MPASNTLAITPFSKSFPLELHGHIARYLPHEDLKSYALASRVLNREANLILWQAVVVSAQQVSGAICGFVSALRRDPLRAGFIRHISFICEINARAYSRSIGSLFPGELTGEFWTSLEEALRLVTHPISIAILELDVIPMPWKSPKIPDRFIDIISNVFKTSRIENLYSHLDSNRLFHLCQIWPSLTTLRAATYEDAPADIPPDALPQLCHLEANTHTICHITPGRPIETLCHVGGVVCWKHDFELLASAVRGCDTLQRIRVNCRAESEDDVDILPAFAHDALRFFHLRISLEGDGMGYYLGPGSLRLAPSMVMQALPSGALALFPKLEVLQILLSHNDFAIAVDDPNYEDMNRVENALMSFLISEGHTTLRQVDVDCSFYYHGGELEVAIRFRAARHDGRWHVKTVIHKGPESSILTRFEDVLAGHR